MLLLRIKKPDNALCAASSLPVAAAGPHVRVAAIVSRQSCPATPCPSSARGAAIGQGAGQPLAASSLCPRHRRTLRLPTPHACLPRSWPSLRRMSLGIPTATGCPVLADHLFGEMWQRGATSGEGIASCHGLLPLRESCPDIQQHKHSYVSSLFPLLHLSRNC